MGSDFLRFRRMITPVIIEFVFWIGVIAAVIIAFGLMRDSVGLGLLALIVGPLLVRVYCELLILFFRMNETLTDIRGILQDMNSNLERTERVATRIT